MVTGSNPARSLGNLYSAYPTPIKIPSCFHAHKPWLSFTPLGPQVMSNEKDIGYARMTWTSQLSVFNLQRSNLGMTSKMVNTSIKQYKTSINREPQEIGWPWTPRNHKNINKNHDESGCLNAQAGRGDRSGLPRRWLVPDHPGTREPWGAGHWGSHSAAVDVFPKKGGHSPGSFLFEQRVYWVDLWECIEIRWIHETDCDGFTFCLLPS